MINTQKIDNGDGNQQANGDINNITCIIKNYTKDSNKEPLIFYEKDIKEVILHFSNEIENIETNDNELDELKKIPLDEKNELNNLSEEYFENIKEDDMEFFTKIDLFLKDTKNKEYLTKYKMTVKELKRIIIIIKDDYDNFEKILYALYNKIFKGNEKELRLERDLIWLFLHYMYCRCHIGKKSKKDDCSA